VNVRPEPPGAGEEEILEAFTELNNELVNLQRELSKTNAELTRANAELTRLDAEKNRFLGMAAHDLRSPLATLLGFARFLEESTRGRLDEEERHFLGVIQRSSGFMLRLVNELLDVSAIESGRLELELMEGDLGEVVETLAALQAPMARAKGLELEVVEEEALPPALFDLDRVQQVLNNLLTNAIKFSEAGGRIRIRVSRSAGEPPMAMVQVQDQGVGIPEALLPDLFRPLGRAGRSGTGGEESTGLGLSIVRRMVEAHGGTVSVESREGEGSTFAFTLPLAPPPPPSAPAPPASVVQAVGDDPGRTPE
jgi:two-component system, OmpR family, sensor kinase